MSNDWKLIEENRSFRNNIDRYLPQTHTPEHTIWSWDSSENIVVAVVSKGDSRREALIFDGEGVYQYKFPVPNAIDVRIGPDAFYFSSNTHSGVSNVSTLLEVNRKSGAQKEYTFVKGATDFEVDSSGRVWFLYGGYYEDEESICTDAGAEKILGSLSLEQLTTALLRVDKESSERPREELSHFYRFSRMTRTSDGRVAVYDPKRDALYDAETKQVLTIDHGTTKPSDNIICFKDWVVLYKHTYIPHDETYFATFFIYKKEEEWNEYSANVEEVFYTRQDTHFPNDIRVMDEDSFVLETSMQKKLSKFKFARNKTLPITRSDKSLPQRRI